jgi:hypothetical protein
MFGTFGLFGVHPDTSRSVVCECACDDIKASAPTSGNSVRNVALA